MAQNCMTYNQLARDRRTQSIGNLVRVLANAAVPVSNIADSFRDALLLPVAAYMRRRRACWMSNSQSHSSLAPSYASRLAVALGLPTVCKRWESAVGAIRIPVQPGAGSSETGARVDGRRIKVRELLEPRVGTVFGAACLGGGSRYGRLPGVGAGGGGVRHLRSGGREAGNERQTSMEAMR